MADASAYCGECTPASFSAVVNLSGMSEGSRERIQGTHHLPPPAGSSPPTCTSGLSKRVTNSSKILTGGWEEKGGGYGRKRRREDFNGEITGMRYTHFRLQY